MAMTDAPARLGGDDLRIQRHVCALLDGPTDAETMLPFILEGFAQGERAVHFVDDRRRAAHLESLERAGVDTESALDDGSLRVETWSDTYLRGGRFDPTSMVALIRSTMADGRALGFARTRLIGYMEWALEDVPGVRRVIDFESRLQVAMQGGLDLMVCAYDIGRHSQSVVLETLLAHPSALIGGVLRPGAGHPASPRERILAAASDRFTRLGVGATGVDTLIESAGVAKATFYRHFPSKDDLIVAWLRDPRTRWLDRMGIEAEEQAQTPADVLPAFFGLVAQWLEADGARGCPYLDTALGMPDLAPAAVAVVREYLAEVERYLHERLVAAGRADADVLAPQLFALLSGGITASVGSGDTHPAIAARNAAVTILAAAPAAAD